MPSHATLLWSAASCCGGCRCVLSVGLAFMSTLATAPAKLVHKLHNCCLQRPFEMTVCHRLTWCMQRLECNQHQRRTVKRLLLQSPSLRKRLLVHSESARAAGCNLLKIFARASSWTDRKIFSRDDRQRGGIAFAQSQPICRTPGQQKSSRPAC